MKAIMQRRHVVRPIDYESIELMARVEVDSSNADDKDYFKGELSATAALLSEDLDVLLDADIDRTLRLNSQHPHIDETHLWVFYEKD